MHKLLGLIAAALMVVGITTTASAGTFTPEISELSVRLGALPPISLRGNTGTTATLATDGSQLDASNGIWTTVNFNTGTALFTGVPGINDLFWTISNATITATTNVQRVNPIGTGAIDSFGQGAPDQPNGQGTVTIQIVQGAISIGIEATAGGRDLNANTTMGGFQIVQNFPIIGNISNTGAPFITQALNITGLNQNIVHVGTGVRASTTGLAFTLLPTTKEPTVPLTSMVTLTTTGNATSMITVTFTNPTAPVTGSKNTTSGVGTVTLVTPVRVVTELAVGNTPSATYYTFRFVPEPGSLLLIGSGVVGLAIIGRRRMKK